MSKFIFWISLLLVVLAIGYSASAKQVPLTVFETDKTSYNYSADCFVNQFSPTRTFISQRLDFPTRDLFITSIDVKVNKVSTVDRDLHFVVLKNEGSEVAYEQYFASSTFPQSPTVTTTTLTFNDPILFPHDDIREFYFVTDSNGTGSYRFYTRWRVPTGDTPPTLACATPLYVREASFISKWSGYYIEPHYSWLYPLVPVALASTTCNFVTNGVTTTAECSDAHTINTTFDIWAGLVLALGVFFWIFGTFYLKRKGVRE